jgi:hypothetical protein
MTAQLRSEGIDVEVDPERYPEWAIRAPQRS